MHVSESREFPLYFTLPITPADSTCSVGLTMARLILAKLHFKFDVEAVDKNLDWVGKARFRLLWDKPELWVRLNGRKGA